MHNELLKNTVGLYSCEITSPRNTVQKLNQIISFTEKGGTAMQVNLTK